MKNFVFTSLFLFLSISLLTGQNIDSEYNTNNFPSKNINKKVVKKTTKAVAIKPSNTLTEKGLASYNDVDFQTMITLANDLRRNHQWEKAEYWYSRVIKVDADPAVMKAYADILYCNGKCEDARRWYMLHNEKVKRKYRFDIESINDCAEKTTLVNPKELEIVNLSILNSEYLDYSAIPYKDGIVFTSNRENNRVSKRVNSWTKETFSDLFFAQRKKAASYKAPKPLKGDINGEHHDGVASFDENEKVMLFSRNNITKKSKKGVIDLKIYQVNQNEKGYWENPQELPINSDEFSTCHPTLSADGNRLYFSSNRPNGFGGMDIYVSRKIDGAWSEPTNLGPTVNSAGNEIFPFINENDLLFFASNGHKGLGGLDVFMVKKDADYDENSWSNRKNIGAPFNTARDDFGFVTSKDNTYGYLSSSRLGGKGDDDLYEWISEMPLEFLKSNKPELPKYELATAKPTMQPTREAIQKALEATTNREKEKVAMKTASNDIPKIEELMLTPPKLVRKPKVNKPAVATIEAAPFEKMTKSKAITSTNANKATSKTSRIANTTALDNTITLNNIYYDFNQSTIRKDAYAELDRLVQILKRYPDMEIELGSHTDAKGSAAYNLRLSAQRAQAAMSYLIGKGIDSNRITAIGYGESKPLIDCDSNHPCSDDTHEKNRRTEVAITRMGQTDVKIIRNL